MKKVLLGLGVLALASSVLAAPAIVVVTQGVAPSDDAALAFAAMPKQAPPAAFEAFPPPSSTDLINGNAGFQIDARTNHGGGAFDLAALTNGAAAVAYPGQLPADFPGVNTPAISIGYALGGPTDIGSVVVYAYNWNGGTPDVRGLAPFAVYTTTDATPSAGGTWTEVLGYTAPSGIPPANVQFYTGNTVPGDWAPYAPAGHAGAIAVADDTGGLLATAVTGVRVDIYCSGFGNTFRNAENTGGDVQAVTSPFLAEIDVLNLAATQAFFTPGASVQNWNLYH